MRQKDPELLKAAEHLAKNEIAAAVKSLADQQRVTEIPNPQDRIAAIAKDYAGKPENTIIVSPTIGAAGRSTRPSGSSCRRRVRSVPTTGSSRP